uniref:Putative LAGLIDADG homing endonuclease n=1 Tax=Dunaliella tertiolecta TaxID=3047 RepID=K7NU56_DUNTE|nr:putative LAGLIDADG homing endonuclease [Dunaliella tertiolecta]
MNKTNMNKANKSFPAKRKNVKITREIRDIIHGYVMSDGYLREGQLTVEQNSESSAFVEWLYSKLEHLTTRNGIKDVQRFDKRTNTTTYSKRFFTRRLLKGFNKMWYKASGIHKKTGKPKYVKTVPKSLGCFFSKTFITVWYAGDGTKIIGSRGAKIEATCFNEEQKLLIKELFKSKYDINIHINKAGLSKTGTQQWTFNINSEDYDKFHNIITEIDLIPKLFPNKLCY